MDRACAELKQLSEIGLVYRRVSCDEALELEPALAPLAGRLSGAIAYDSDESGDAHRYCLALAKRTQAAGAEFRFGAEAAIEMHSGQVAAVIVSGERISADHYVVAAGSYSTKAPTKSARAEVGGFVPFESRGGLVTNEQIDRLRDQDAY